MSQEIIVYAIGLLAAAYIAVSLYRLLSGRNDPCRGCRGCGLKEELEEKKKNCPEKKNKNKPDSGCPGCN